MCNKLIASRSFILTIDKFIIHSINTYVMNCNCNCSSRRGMCATVLIETTGSDGGGGHMYGVCMYVLIYENY